MLTTLNSGHKYAQSFQSSFDLMLEEYSEVIQINLELLKHKKVDIILVAPAIQLTIPFVESLISILSSEFKDELDQSFANGTVPYRPLIKRIESRFLEIVHPDPDIRDFIFSHVIKYVVSQRLGLPIYSIPVVGSYYHRDLLLFLGKWGLDKTLFINPVEKTNKFKTSTHKSKVLTKVLDSSDEDEESLRQSEKGNVQDSSSDESSLEELEESRLESPDSSYTVDLKKLYHGRHKKSGDGNLDESSTKISSAIKGKQTPNIPIKSSQRKDKSNAEKQNQTIRVNSSIQGELLTPFVSTTSAVSKVNVKKRKDTEDLSVSEYLDSRKKRSKTSNDKKESPENSPSENLASHKLPAADRYGETSSQNNSKKRKAEGVQNSSAATKINPLNKLLKRSDSKETGPIINIVSIEKLKGTDAVNLETLFDGCSDHISSTRSVPKTKTATREKHGHEKKSPSRRKNNTELSDVSSSELTGDENYIDPISPAQRTLIGSATQTSVCTDGENSIHESAQVTATLDEQSVHEQASPSSRMNDTESNDDPTAETTGSDHEIGPVTSAQRTLNDNATPTAVGTDGKNLDSENEEEIATVDQQSDHDQTSPSSNNNKNEFDDDSVDQLKIGDNEINPTSPAKWGSDGNATPTAVGTDGKNSIHESAQVTATLDEQSVHEQASPSSRMNDTESNDDPTAETTGSDHEIGSVTPAQRTLNDNATPTAVGTDGENAIPKTDDVSAGKSSEVLTTIDPKSSAQRAVDDTSTPTAVDTDGENSSVSEIAEQRLQQNVRQVWTYPLRRNNGLKLDDVSASKSSKVLTTIDPKSSAQRAVDGNSTSMSVGTDGENSSAYKIAKQCLQQNVRQVRTYPLRRNNGSKLDDVSASKSSKVLTTIYPKSSAQRAVDGNSTSMSVRTDGENSVPETASGANDTRMLVDDPDEIPQTAKLQQSNILAAALKSTTKAKAKARPTKKKPDEQVFYDSDGEIEAPFLGFPTVKKKCAQPIEEKVVTSETTDTRNFISSRLRKRKPINYKI
ncbi:Protein of unknown function [Cotesia congregata]|uniref:Uncharacterized protein n=1 Tax=Cotesia congregata TaxID=51543 RepID=A0A8J2HIY3_COTCN|nr:Protein of unknown function [Cotesia congregata]